MTRSSHSNTSTGWREWVGLPELGIEWLKAKIDTGARTSSLHAFDVDEFDRDGEEWVRFTVCPWQDSTADAVVHEARVHDRRAVRSSSGRCECAWSGTTSTPRSRSPTEMRWASGC